MQPHSHNRPVYLERCDHSRPAGRGLNPRTAVWITAVIYVITVTLILAQAWHS